LNENQRFHRPDPERTAPRRNWSGLYRSSDSWGRPGATLGPAPDPLATISGFVGDLLMTGAKLGAMVLDSMEVAGGPESRPPGADGRDARSRSKEADGQ